MVNSISILWTLICSMCWIALPLHAQELQEETVLLSIDNYLDIVTSYHPIMRQAEILTDMADPIRREARGGFDPIIDGAFDGKQFRSTNYYRDAYAAVKVPTWYGIELKADYQRTSGDFLNPAESLPDRGLWSAGLSIGLGRGLVLDERRAALLQADIYTNASQQERIIMINDLLYDAMLAYLDWQQAYQQLLIAMEGLALADQRFVVTKQSWINGDMPAIDTLESDINVQTRQLSLFEAEQILNNARINLEFYLWQDAYTPLELVDNAIPEQLDMGYLDADIKEIAINQSNIITTHPELQAYAYKLESLEVDRRLLREDIKPDIRLSYNPIIGTTEQTLFASPRIADYKLGASIYYPILQRKARGKVQQTQLKIEDAQRGIESKELTIKTKLDAYLNDTEYRLQQLQLLDITVTDYKALLAAENKKFGIGESSIFLLNSREVKYLDSRLKRVSTLVKLIKDRMTYLYSAGQMQRLP